LAGSAPTTVGEKTGFQAAFEPLLVLLSTALVSEPGFAAESLALFEGPVVLEEPLSDLPAETLSLSFPKSLCVPLLPLLA